MTLRTLLVLGGLGLAPWLSACDKGPSRSEAATAAPTATTPTAATPVQPTGQTLGAGVKLQESVSIDALLADPMKHAGKTVRVEGMITDVCPKRGCWMNLAGGEAGQKLKFKVVDGDMVFPMESKGKWAVAEGVVAARELTIEETREQAEYEAKEYGIKYDPASITKPKISVRIDGTGAVIRDKK
ncbi:MAG: DUF4920 domain-containing protein [Kofleriaceae bacterium]